MDTQITAIFFASNMESAQSFLKEQGYVPNMLGKAVSIVVNIELQIYFSQCLICCVTSGDT